MVKTYTKLTHLNHRGLKRTGSTQELLFLYCSYEIKVETGQILPMIIHKGCSSTCEWTRFWRSAGNTPIPAPPSLSPLHDYAMTMTSWSYNYFLYGKINLWVTFCYSRGGFLEGRMSSWSCFTGLLLTSGHVRHSEQNIIVLQECELTAFTISNRGNGRIPSQLSLQKDQLQVDRKLGGCPWRPLTWHLRLLHLAGNRLWLRYKPLEP